MSAEKKTQITPELVSRKYVRQSQIRIILHNLRKNKGAMIGRMSFSDIFRPAISVS